MSKTLKIVLSVCVLAFVLLMFIFINTNANEDVTTDISSQEAIEIALDYIGGGTSDHVELINENGVDIYEVGIEHDEVTFFVYVHAESGDVVRMSRFEEGYEGITTLPEVISPDDLELEDDE